MIKTYADIATEKIWNGEYVKNFPNDIQRTAKRKLVHINSAGSLNDLSIPPENKLERLKGSMQNTYSIRINDQWRICFKWIDGNAYDVKIVDYH